MESEEFDSFDNYRLTRIRVYYQLKQYINRIKKSKISGDNGSIVDNYWNDNFIDQVYI